MEQTPPLSVVMSVYNGEEFVAAAIECILNQTYKDFELVLINDGSKDDSLAIMQQYADRDPRIRIIDQENTGLTIALIRGVEAARGKYIARMDVDDESTPDRFEQQMAMLNANPEMVAVTSDIEIFDEEGSPLTVRRLRGDPRILPLHLVFSNKIGGHGQMIYRRDAYFAAGGYDTEYNYAEDYDLWTRLIEQGPFGVVPKVLYRYRVGHESISSLNAVRQAKVAGRIARRQYEKLTGQSLDEKTASAINDFLLNRLITELTPDEIRKASSAMSRAVDVFFADHPELRPEEYEVRRGIAARWWWRRTHVTLRNPIHLVAVLAQVLRWGLGAVRARYSPV